MDFIIANWSPSLTVEGELTDFRYSELDKMVSQSFHDQVFHMVWGGESSVLVEPYRCFAFDGVTSIGQHLFHSTLGAQKPIELATAMQKTELPAPGIYCVVNIRRESSTYIRLATDWLGQYPLYFWRQRHRFAVSNNIRMLERLTGAARSILPAVENLVTGGVSEHHIHLENTVQLSYGHELHIFNGQAQLVQRKELSLKAVSYRECLQNLRESAADHIAATLAHNGNAEPYIICDLTGGSDSRAVLALLLDQSEDRPIHIRTMGRYPNPDVNVAAYLQHRYGLRRGHFPSVAAPRDLAVRFNAVLSGGAREAGAVLSPVGFPNLIHFKGCYGEIGGATPGHDFIAEAFRSGLGLHEAIDILFARRRRAGAVNFVSESALDMVRAILFEEYQRLIDFGYSAEQLFSERYIRTRARTHFGLLSFMENKSKILPDILANRWIIEAARRLPAGHRSQNKVIFDLIRDGRHGELAFMPMANKKWSENVVEFSDRENLNQMKVININSAELIAGNGSMYASITVPAHMPKGYRTLVDVVSSTSGVTPQFANLASYRAISEHFAEVVSRDSAVWWHFDRDLLLKDLRRQDDEFRIDGIDVNALGIFASGVAWMNGFDCVVPLKRQNVFNPDPRHPSWK